jgi:hypothetical protein
MNEYEILRVAVRSGNSYDLDARQSEVERYIYGRHFVLDRVPQAETDPRKPMHDLFILVEAHYAQAIIDRLASGLIFARRTEAEGLVRGL